MISRNTDKTMQCRFSRLHIGADHIKDKSGPKCYDRKHDLWRVAEKLGCIQINRF